MKQFQIIFNKYFDFLKRSDSGMTMMEIILSIGLFGLVAVMGARFFGSSIGTQEHIIVRGEVEDVRDLIRSSIDCDKTMINQVTACGTSQYIEIRKQDNTVLIPKISPFGAMGGGVEVRSKCSTGDGFYKLDMEYRRVANGAVIKDQMNGKMYDWAPLFANVPVSCPNVVADLREKCGSSTEEVLNIRLDFPSTKGAECRWGLDGNLSRATGNGQVRAVLGQVKRFSMPKNSALCSVAFNGGTTVINYDDFLHFTFDDFVLASTQFTESEFLAMGMQKNGDLIKYDRVKHIGKGPYNEYMNNRTNAICPKTGSCSMVQSQKSGSLAINAPKTWFDLLPAATLLNSEHDLTVWVTGQKQPTDCQHTGMGFDLIIKYVQ